MGKLFLTSCEYKGIISLLLIFEQGRRRIFPREGEKAFAAASRSAPTFCSDSLNLGKNHLSLQPF